VAAQWAASQDGLSSVSKYVCMYTVYMYTHIEREIRWESFNLNYNCRFLGPQLATCFTLISCLDFFSAVKTEDTFTSKI
jgi:hypothetical protein